MKNLFLGKNIIQKLIIALVIVILFNFVSPTVSSADFIGSFAKKLGGVLIEPIMDFIVAVVDGALGLMQSNFMDDIDIVVNATTLDQFTELPSDADAEITTTWVFPFVAKMGVEASAVVDGINTNGTKVRRCIRIYRGV